MGRRVLVTSLTIRPARVSVSRPMVHVGVPDGQTFGQVPSPRHPEYAPAVSIGGPQRDLVLIIARELASKLATPAFLVDARGDVVFYNEAAGELLGRPFVESRGMPASEWSTVFRPVDDAGTPIPLEELPLGRAITQGVPTHRTFFIESEDGVARRIDTTALPLYSHAEAFVGGLAVFWESSGER
jgi:PAS domain-containing protein